MWLCWHSATCSGVPVAIIVFVLVLQPDQTIINGYQQERILAWLEPEKYANSTAYQQTNAMMAIGSGQLWGKGLNNNMVSSVKNGNFVSEPQTDFIFTIIGEELGFIIAATVIILYLISYTFSREKQNFAPKKTKSAAKVL